MTRAVLSFLALLFSLTAAQPTVAQDLTNENFASSVFATFCLATEGNTDRVKAIGSSMTAQTPPLAVELSKKDRKELFGKDTTDAWLLSREPGLEPVYLSLKKGPRSVVCEITTTGSISDHKNFFETTLMGHSVRSNGKIYNSGDASFLNDPNIVGHAYTLKTDTTSAYIMLLEERSDNSKDSAVLKLTALFA